MQEVEKINKDVFDDISKAEKLATMLYGKIKWRICAYCLKVTKCKKAEQGKYEEQCKKCCIARDLLMIVNELRFLIRRAIYKMLGVWELDKLEGETK